MIDKILLRIISLATWRYVNRGFDTYERQERARHLVRCMTYLLKKDAWYDTKKSN